MYIYCLNVGHLICFRSFFVAIIMNVYIPLQANAKIVVAQLHSAISKQQAGAFIIAGDFNQVN